MKFGISDISIIPVRKDPSERSEMVSQILFGEHFQVLEKRSKWCKIITTHDNYEGWIDRKMCNFVSEEQYNTANNSKSPITNELINILTESNNDTTVVTSGSSLPFYSILGKTLELNDKKFTFHGENPIVNDDIRANILKLSYNYINAPYLWGGRTPFGIDCSGYSQILYKINGINIPRDASQQVNMGETVNFIMDAKPGDLAFFDNDDGNITHVGILLGNGEIIHASGKVRVDIIDHQGIYNKELKQYTHKLRVIKDIISSQ